MKSHRRNHRDKKAREFTEVKSYRVKSNYLMAMERLVKSQKSREIIKIIKIKGIRSNEMNPRSPERRGREKDHNKELLQGY